MILLLNSLTQIIIESFYLCLSLNIEQRRISMSIFYSTTTRKLPKLTREMKINYKVQITTIDVTWLSTLTEI